MNTMFKQKLVLVTSNGECSPMIKGVMREDETAAILDPECKYQLKDAHMLRHHRATFDTREYIIRRYFHDTQRPLGNDVTKPIVVQLYNPADH